MDLFPGSKNNRSRLKNHDAVEKRTPYVSRGFKVKMKQKEFFMIFKGLLVAKNCIRIESAPLTFL